MLLGDRLHHFNMIAKVMYESNRECSEMVFHTSLFKMIWSLLISDQLCCIANRQMTDFLSLCPYPLLPIWTSLNWDPCPWVWLCVCVCVCVCVWWPLLWHVRTLISHMPHSWPWNKELWDCLVYDQHTHIQLSLAFIGFYVSDCWCISPSHGKKRLLVWETDEKLSFMCLRSATEVHIRTKHQMSASLVQILTHN